MLRDATAVTGNVISYRPTKLVTGVSTDSLVTEVRGHKRKVASEQARKERVCCSPQGCPHVGNLRFCIPMAFPKQAFPPEMRG